jgi:hypothetical protein
MNQAPELAASNAGHYELRFLNLFSRRCGYAFPCDAEGHVQMDELSDRGRLSYLYARALVGSELSSPTVAVVARQP